MFQTLAGTAAYTFCQTPDGVGHMVRHQVGADNPKYKGYQDRCQYLPQNLLSDPENGIVLLNSHKEPFLILKRRIRIVEMQLFRRCIKLSVIFVFIQSIDLVKFTLLDIQIRPQRPEPFSQDSGGHKRSPLVLLCALNQQIPALFIFIQFASRKHIHNMAAGYLHAHNPVHHPIADQGNRVGKRRIFPAALTLV